MLEKILKFYTNQMFFCCFLCLKNKLGYSLKQKKFQKNEEIETFYA